MNQKRSSGYQFILTVIFSFLAVAINYGISFAITPYITENIGTDAYGFVSLAKIFANYGSIVTIALNSFAARYIAIEYHKGNYKKANQYYSSVFYADVAVCTVLLVLFSIVIVFLDYFISIPKELIGDVKRLFLLDVINFLIISIGSVFMVTTTISNRLELTGMIKSASYFLEAVFLVVAYTILPPKVYYVGIGLIVSSLFFASMHFLTTSRLTPVLKINRKDYSKPAVADLVKAGIWNSVNSLGNLLNSGLDLLVSNVMLSALQSGQLAIVKTVSLIYTTIMPLIAQPFQPQQLKYYAMEEKGKLIDSFKIAMKIDGMFSNIFMAGFVVFGSVFYKLWVPKEDVSLLFAISVVTVIGVLTEGATYPLFYAYTLTVKNKIPCYVTLATGVLNVIGMIVLIEFFNAGLFAVVGTTTVILLLEHAIFTPIYSAYCLKIPKWTFYPVLIKHLLSAVLMVVAFMGIKSIIQPERWIGLILVAILCALVGAVLHAIVVFDKSEWSIVRKKLKRN